MMLLRVLRGNACCASDGCKTQHAQSIYFWTREPCSRQQHMKELEWCHVSSEGKSGLSLASPLEDACLMYCAISVRCHAGMQEVPSTSSAAANPFAAIRAVVEPAALPAGRKPGSPRQSEVCTLPKSPCMKVVCVFCFPSVIGKGCSMLKERVLKPSQNIAG